MESQTSLAAREAALVRRGCKKVLPLNFIW
jgi:hypothetical protein